MTTTTVKNFLDERCEAYWLGRRLCANLRPGFSIHATLGSVKAKNDGRWEWFIHFPKDTNRFFPAYRKPAKVQGVAATEAEAMVQVEKCWGLSLREVSHAV